ncbi:MAG: hypothetical protein HY897_07535 [Deltaproteobacteria bacterium]|nr:hypothetical protein [Deltaproteobacteria bacterium]
MLRIKIWIILPVLVVVPALTGFYLFTEVLVGRALEGVERELDHTRGWLSAAVQSLAERELRLSAQKAHRLSESGLGAAWAAPESAKKPAKKGKDERSPDEARDALKIWLRESSPGREGELTAIFNTEGEVLAAHPAEAAGDVAACSNSKALMDALAGTAAAGFVRAGENVFAVGVSPLRDGGTVAAALCGASRIHDRAAAEIKASTGYEASIFDGPRILGSTLRQSNPEILADLATKSGFVLQGSYRSGETPMFVGVPQFATLVAPVATDAGQIGLGVTAGFEPAVKGFRSLQRVYLLAVLLVLALAVVVAWSIHSTLVRTVNVIAEGLAPVAKGNLHAQVPVTAVEKPLSGIAEAINRTLYAVRERGQFFSAKKKAELGGVLGGVSASAPAPSDAAAPQAAEPRAPSGEFTLEAVSGVRAAAHPEEMRDAGRSAPLSGEIHVGEEMDETTYGGGEEQAQITSRDYNPEATVVAMVPSEYMEQVDKELEAMRAAKDASRSDPLTAVYHEFLQARLRCGEKVENLSQERFVEKLKKTREDVMSKSGCKDVRFNVVVKDGKASIKASPIK